MEIGLLNKVSLGRFSDGFRKDLSKVALRYFGKLSRSRLIVTTRVKLKTKKCQSEPVEDVVVTY